MIRFIIGSVFIILFLTKDSSCQVVTTYSGKPEEKLPCSIDENTVGAEWLEFFDNGTVMSTIFSYTRDQTMSPEQPGGKYSNFALDLVVGTNFDLIIQSVDKDDGGIYECSLFPIMRTRFELVVQVTASSVDIDYNGNGIVNATESYPFTCTAVGVRSPNELELIWSTNNVMEKTGTEEKDNSQNPDLKDLTSTYTFMPKKNDSFIQCGITGYVNQEEIEEDLITNTVQLNVQYVPTCKLELGNSELADSCTVMMTCSCDANPEVNAGGYSYFKNNLPIAGESNTATGDVDLETEAEFSCSASNSVGSGEQSLGVPFVCSSTTISPPTTTIDTTPVNTTLNNTTPTANAATTMKPFKTTTGNPTGGPNALVIVFSCLGGIVALCGLAALIYFFCLREPSNSSKGNNSVRDDESDIVLATSNQGTHSSPPVYGVIDKDKKKKSDDNTDGNGVNSTNSDQTYAAVNKPPKTEPKAAPRSSAPSAGGESEKMELQYADIDHGNKGPSFEIHQPADAPTEYATVQSVIV